jgi:hypothetical protein
VARKPHLPVSTNPTQSQRQAAAPPRRSSAESHRHKPDSHFPAAPSEQQHAREPSPQPHRKRRAGPNAQTMLPQHSSMLLGLLGKFATLGMRSHRREDLFVGHDGAPKCITCRGVAQPGSAPALGARFSTPTTTRSTSNYQQFQQIGESAFSLKANLKFVKDLDSGTVLVQSKCSSVCRIFDELRKDFRIGDSIQDLSAPEE